LSYYLFNFFHYSKAQWKPRVYPAEDCFIIPTLSISWWDLIFASVGLFFKIGMKDFEKYISL